MADSKRATRHAWYAKTAALGSSRVGNSVSAGTRPSCFASASRSSNGSVSRTCIHAWLASTMSANPGKLAVPISSPRSMKRAAKSS